MKFRKFHRKVTQEAFNCYVCKEFKIEKEGYRTKNLIYKCLECFNKEKEG